jgi:hypothetical protein
VAQLQTLILSIKLNGAFDLRRTCIPVLRIRIRRIRVFLGFPDPDPLVQCTIRILSSSSKNSKKNLDSVKTRNDLNKTTADLFI